MMLAPGDTTVIQAVTDTVMVSCPNMVPAWRLGISATLVTQVTQAQWGVHCLARARGKAAAAVFLLLTGYKN